MLANDCLRRLRYILNLDDSGMIGMFAAAGQEGGKEGGKKDGKKAGKKVTRAQISAYLKKEDDPGYEECSDLLFATFLNGLINQKRGKKDGKTPEPEKRLSNNIIFRKLKIAFNLQADEILSILSLADLRISKHELSAFFRKTDNRHYRVCKDQILRNFLMGLQIKYRGESQAEDEEVTSGANAEEAAFRWKQPNAGSESSEN